MMNLIERLNKSFIKNNKYLIQTYWKKNLDDLYQSRNHAVNDLMKINREIEKTELIVFGT